MNREIYLDFSSEIKQALATRGKQKIRLGRNMLNTDGLVALMSN